MTTAVMSRPTHRSPSTVQVVSDEHRVRPARRLPRRLWVVARAVALTLIALLVTDLASGLVYRTSTDASLLVTESRSGRTNELLVVFGGYASDCTSISMAFGPELDDLTALAVLCYPERGIDDDQVANLVMEQVRELQPKHLRVLGGSLGGLVAVRFLARYSASPEESRTGPVVLVLDTAPSDSDTVRRPSWMFTLCDWYRGGVVSSGVWHVVSGLGRHPAAEPGADPEPIRQGNRANANIGVPALTSQAAYLASFRASEISSISGVVERVTYIEGNPSEADPLINVKSAIATWSRALPNLTVHELPERNGEWHVPWTYRPAETLAAVMSA